MATTKKPSLHSVKPTDGPAAEANAPKVEAPKMTQPEPIEPHKPLTAVEAAEVSSFMSDMQQASKLFQDTVRISVRRSHAQIKAAKLTKGTDETKRAKAIDKAHSTLGKEVLQAHEHAMAAAEHFEQAFSDLAEAHGIDPKDPSKKWNLNLEVPQWERTK